MLAPQWRRVSFFLGKIFIVHRGREVTIGIACGRRLDLDHPCAKVGQERRRIGPGDKRRALDDGEDPGESELACRIIPCALVDAPTGQRGVQSGLRVWFRRA